MRVTRRTFLKVAAASAAALGLSQTQLMQLAEKVLSREGTPKVMWIQGQACSGDTMALANLQWDGKTPEPGYPAGLPAEVYTYLKDNVGAPWTGSQTLAGVTQPDSQTTVDDVLLDIIDLNYHQTLMATGGAEAHSLLKDAMAPGGFNGGLLVVEGAIPTNDNEYCTIGSNVDGNDELFVGNVVAQIAKPTGSGGGNAAAVVAVGTCASFGGIPGANSDSARPKTGAMSVESWLQLQGITPPLGKVVKVPGCHTNGLWSFGTIVHYVLGDLLANLDDYGRPKFYYGSTNHGGRCPRYQDYSSGVFMAQPGTPVSGSAYGGCLAMLGCKGFSTYADCVFGGPSATQKGRGWNVVSRDSSGNVTSGGNSCINNGWPCQGCTEKAFPDRFSPFLRTV